MKHNRVHTVRHFFTTAPLPCPYLPGRTERRVVTELSGRDVATQHDALSLAGFRRSHGVAYAPACPQCSQCIPVRVDAERFEASRNQRRVWKKNAHLVAEELPPIATEEQFRVFHDYQQGRHGDGEMAKMDFRDYQALVEDTPVETRIVEFREPDGRLAAGCLVDGVAGGLSAVYSFFRPELADRSLGSYMIMWMLERARERGLRYVYLGFWVEDCAKMSYKTRFRPCEAFIQGEWQPFAV